MTHVPTNRIIPATSAIPAMAAIPLPLIALVLPILPLPDLTAIVPLSVERPLPRFCPSSCWQAAHCPNCPT